MTSSRLTWLFLGASCLALGCSGDEGAPADGEDGSTEAGQDGSGDGTGDPSDEGGSGDPGDGTGSSGDEVSGSPYTPLANACGNNNRTRQQTSAVRDGAPSETWVFTYDDDDNLLTEEYDQNSDGYFNSLTTHTYDDRNNMLTQIVDRDYDGAADEESVWTYDDDNMVRHETDPGGAFNTIKTYTYNEHNQMLTEGNETSVSVTYTYEESEPRRMLSKTVGTSEYFTWEYKQVNACRFTIDDAVTCDDKPEEECTDGCAWILRTVSERVGRDAPPNPRSSPETVQSYVNGGRTMYERGSSGTVVHSYDENGNLILQANAGKFARKWTYDANGNETSFWVDQDGDGERETENTATYDEEGRTTARTYDGNTTWGETYTYTCE